MVDSTDEIFQNSQLFFSPLSLHEIHQNKRQKTLISKTLEQNLKFLTPLFKPPNTQPSPLNLPKYSTLPPSISPNTQPSPPQSPQIPNPPPLNLPKYPTLPPSIPQNTQTLKFISILFRLPHFVLKAPTHHNTGTCGKER